jgi:ABC-2 type transport system ATP-binding protein
VSNGNGEANGYAGGGLASGRLALEVDGLVKRYGRATAVDGIDLRVAHGEVFGFLGPNGAGKTTTIGMILGLLAPSAGTVRLFGRAVRGNERALLPRVGALVEMPTFYPYLGARDNLRAVALVTGGVTGKQVERTLALVGLISAADKPYRTFSLGMKQRLGIGAALLADPDLVILDEPTNGLDPAGIVEIRQLLRELAAAGKAVFLSSHQLNEVQQICDRVAIVNAGRIVAEGYVAALLRDQRLLRATVSDTGLAQAVAGSLEWVEEARIEGETLVVRGEPPTPFALGEALARAGVWIGQLTRSEGSLEQLFLRLTGPAVEPAANGHRPGANGAAPDGASPLAVEVLAGGR